VVQAGAPEGLPAEAGEPGRAAPAAGVEELEGDPGDDGLDLEGLPDLGLSAAGPGRDQAIVPQAVGESPRGVSPSFARAVVDRGGPGLS